MKQYINPILTACSLIALLTTIYFQNERINQFKVEVKTYQTTVDSLHDELFIKHIMNGRYELTLDHLQEVNPKAALEFVNYMNHETEQHIFISAMIKLTKNNGKEYIVINTEMQAGDSTAPVIIQISLKDVSEEDKLKMYQTASLLLNRTIKRSTPKPVVEKVWYKFWQGQNSYVNLGYENSYYWRHPWP